MELELINVPSHMKPYLEGWADIVIKKWKFNLISRNIKDTGDLLSSFEQTVHLEAGGNKGYIHFAFNYYLRMIDMGVGNGTPIGEVGEQKIQRGVRADKRGVSRRAKPVYAKIMFGQVARLAELLQIKYGLTGAQIIVNEF